MSDIIDDAKRLRLFDKVFLWLGENKLTLGELGAGEHFTMLVNKEGILDIHNTIDGSEKKYESVLKLNLKQLAEQLENNPDIIQNFTQEIMNNVKQVTFAEPEFAECKIVNVKNKEEMANLARKEKRTVILDENAVNEAEFIPWFEAKGKVKEKALVLDKTGSSIGYLIREGDRIFFMNGDFMINSFFSKLIMDMAVFYDSK